MSGFGGHVQDKTVKISITEAAISQMYTLVEKGHMGRQRIRDKIWLEGSDYLL